MRRVGVASALSLLALHAACVEVIYPPAGTKTTIMASGRTERGWSVSVRASDEAGIQRLPSDAEGSAYLITSRCTPTELELETSDYFAEVPQLVAKTSPTKVASDAPPVPATATVQQLSDGSTSASDLSELVRLRLRLRPSWPELMLVDEYPVRNLARDRRVLAAPYGQDEVVAAELGSNFIRRLNATRLDLELEPSPIAVTESIATMAAIYAANGGSSVLATTTEQGQVHRAVLFSTEGTAESIPFAAESDPDLPFLPEILVARLHPQLRAMAIGTRGTDLRRGVPHVSVLQPDRRWSAPQGLVLAPPFAADMVSGALDDADELIAFKSTMDVWSVRNAKSTGVTAFAIAGSPRGYWTFREGRSPELVGELPSPIHCTVATPLIVASDPSGVAYTTENLIVYAPNDPCRRCRTYWLPKVQGLALTTNFVVAFERDAVVAWFSRPR